MSSGKSAAASDLVASRFADRALDVLAPRLAGYPLALQKTVDLVRAAIAKSR